MLGPNPLVVGDRLAVAKNPHPVKVRDDLDPVLREEVDLILDAGPLPGTASTVVDLSGYAADGSWRVLREGAVDRRTLGRLLDLYFGRA